MEAQGRFWRNAEMRLPDSACQRSVILCKCRVGEVVGLLEHDASR